MFTAPGVDQMLHCQSIMSQKSWKPHVEIAPNCPRCASSNTKFCYYNNYSLSQPRYFCKGCRRYWTKGGSLRNVPVGGGCRKTHRTRSSRLSQPDRLSSSACYNHKSSSSEEPSSEGGTNGSDIDMAVVFAKFLNNHHDRDPKAVSSELMCDDDDGDDHDENAFSVQSQISSQRAAEDLLESVDLLEELVLPDHDLRQQVQVDNIQSFMGNQHHHDMSINHQFGLQGLLGDEDLVQDVFWSEATANNLTGTSPCFTWQELDNSFPSHDDDHTKTSAANMCDDNWSSLDFSCFEVFSRS